MSRCDGRNNGALRDVKFTRNFILYPEGSVLVEFGNTKVICNATIEDEAPHHARKTGSGWVTAEYSMLPRATSTRNSRDISKMRQSPRSVEIQRLIGRSLRAGINLKALGERTIIVDCDVIQADGGTRTAAITGGFLALYDACQLLIKTGALKSNPVTTFISAVSVGVVDNEILLDLCYREDSRAGTDLNVVMTESGEFVEVQGTGEGAPFTGNQLNEMLACAKEGCGFLIAAQKKILGF